MHILLSPSKTLNEQVKIPSLDFTQPHFLKQAAQLVEILKKNFSIADTTVDECQS